MPPNGVVSLVSRLAPVAEVPADYVQNVVHVGVTNPGLDLDDAEACCNAFRDFYITTAPGASDDLSHYVSDQISRVPNACTIMAYYTTDLTGATPAGSPVATVSFGMAAAAGGSPLPDEVAVCCSFHGDLTDVPVSATNPTPPPATIRPQQRRRGRLFLGPLQQVAGTEVLNQLRPTPTLRDDLGKAFKDLAETVNAIDPLGLYLGVWSKADADVWQITGGYVDNAWDTQRRRGVEATTRDVFVVS